ncbi:MAG: hypothetical protein HKM87_08680 [Ignavibacteriaceae bacterium]|nr:hypothetical protein [Ignavibacteriaceae bacterium]
MKSRSYINFPFYGWIGILLIIIFWYLNWHLEGLRTHILFFPLWLGYSLTIDAIVFYRKGTSLFKRNVKKYFSLFLISAPAWWLFELINLATQNWIYDGRLFFTDLEYALLATLSFSTVIPAVFGTAELVGSFNWIQKIKPGIKIPPTRSILIIHFFIGWLMLLLMIIFPQFFFLFLWMTLIFILEPVNVWLKNRTLFKYISVGDWRPVVSLWIGCLICGFFWEMWNYFSYPKWIYEVPLVDFFNIFEMPLIGYLGYLPFSLELFALYHFVAGILKIRDKNYIQIV